MAGILAQAENARREGGSLAFESWAHGCDYMMAIGDADPSNTIGELFTAMDMWHKMGIQDQETFEQLCYISGPTQDGKTKFPLKGAIPIEMFTLLNHLYPNFMKDEFFLDELFTRYPRLANPRWTPKPASEKILRGPATCLKHVWDVLEDGTEVPALKLLKYGG